MTVGTRRKVLLTEPTQKRERNQHGSRMDLGRTFFGHRDGDNLWTHDGHHVGKFYGDEVYGCDGRYLGESEVSGLDMDKTPENGIGLASLI